MPDFYAPKMITPESVHIGCESGRIFEISMVKINENGEEKPMCFDYRQKLEERKHYLE